MHLVFTYLDNPQTGHRWRQHKLCQPLKKDVTQSWKAHDWFCSQYRTRLHRQLLRRSKEWFCCFWTHKSGLFVLFKIGWSDPSQGKNTYVNLVWKMCLDRVIFHSLCVAWSLSLRKDAFSCFSMKLFLTVRASKSLFVWQMCLETYCIFFWTLQSLLSLVFTKVEHVPSWSGIIDISASFRGEGNYFEQSRLESPEDYMCICFSFSSGFLNVHFFFFFCSL